MSEQVLIHEASERGQSRELRVPEVGAHTLMAAVEGVALASAAGLTVIVVQGVQGDVAIGTAAVVGGVVGGLSFYFHLSRNFAELRDGLRSWRSIETYLPPEPKPVSLPSSPIIVKPYGASPYVLDRSEPARLPDGRNVELGLNPPTLAAILSEVLEHHGGQWSRKRLMAIRVNGQRITRKLYEQLTGDLARAGFLQERTQGGFALPADIQDFEDLERYFPALPGLRTAGGAAGGQEWGRGGDTPAFQEGNTLAERHRRARWVDLDHEVQNYLGGRP